VVDVVPQAPGLVEPRRSAELEYAMQQFVSLVDDPTVGHEARIRLAYLHYRSEEYEEARRNAELAASTTSDVDLRYVASFLAGQSAQALGDLTGAEALYTAALTSRPRAQSASLALAALQFLRGAAGPAYELFNGPRRSRHDDDDPWRLFLYGDFPRLPSLMRELRARLTR
jgi:tetratricopeptide (TPR) repeat protein